MHDVHMFGRTYTPERNEKVYQVVKKWTALHPEHYKSMGIKGALKARKLGLSGVPGECIDKEKTFALAS